MISFSEYITKPPQILCGIRITKKELLEDLHVEPFHFIIPKADAPKYNGAIGDAGIMHQEKFGTDAKFLVQREPGKPPIEFSDLEAAKNFQKGTVKKHKSELNKIHDGLMAHYYQVHNTHGPVLAQYGDGSSTLNYKLMHINTEPKSERDVPVMALKLDHATRARHTPDSMVVYTGVSSNHGSKLDTADVVHHPAFLSTSLLATVAGSFARSQGSNHIMKIHVPSDHPGVYVGDVSRHAHEHEFLLPRGLKIRIHKDKESILRTSSGDFRVHHCTIES